MTDLTEAALSRETHALFSGRLLWWPKARLVPNATRYAIRSEAFSLLKWAGLLLQRAKDLHEELSQLKTVHTRVRSHHSLHLLHRCVVPIIAFSQTVEDKQSAEHRLDETTQVGAESSQAGAAQHAQLVFGHAVQALRATNAEFREHKERSRRVLRGHEQSRRQVLFTVQTKLRGIHDSANELRNVAQVPIWPSSVQLAVHLAAARSRAVPSAGPTARGVARSQHGSAGLGLKYCAEVCSGACLSSTFLGATNERSKRLQPSLTRCGARTSQLRVSTHFFIRRCRSRRKSSWLSRPSMPRLSVRARVLLSTI